MVDAKSAKSRVLKCQNEGWALQYGESFASVSGVVNHSIIGCYNLIDFFPKEHKEQIADSS